ncbi:MAG: lamin tail domain-containing protein [Planctomycetota bacterium]
MRMRLALASLVLAIFAASAGAQVYINEFCSDPNGAAFVPTTGDFNLDGTGSSAEDEFVEIVNAGAVSVDISGWTVSDAVAVRHTFQMGTMLPAGSAIIVFGGGSSLATFNAQGAGLGVFASSGFTSFNVAGDTITIADSLAVVVDSYTYPDGGGSDIGDGESVVRDPEAPGSAFSFHTVAGLGLRASPGFHSDGTTPYLPASEMTFSYNYPGNGGDVALNIRVNGSQVTTFTGDVAIGLSDNFAFEILSPLGSTNNNGFALIYSVYTTGAAPAGIPIQGAGFPLDVWIDPFTLPTFVPLDGLNPTNPLLIPTVSPFGFDFGPFDVPPTVVGMGLSAIFQVFAAAPGSGLFLDLAISDAIALDLP